LGLVLRDGGGLVKSIVIWFYDALMGIFLLGKNMQLKMLVAVMSVLCCVVLDSLLERGGGERGGEIGGAVADACDLDGNCSLGEGERWFGVAGNRKSWPGEAGLE
jgi:hypothetical protein